MIIVCNPQIFGFVYALHYLVDIDYLQCVVYCPMAVLGAKYTKTNNPKK